MSDQHSKVLSFGPFKLSIGSRLLTNGATIVPLGARHGSPHRPVEHAKVDDRKTLIERVWPKRGADKSACASTSQRNRRLSIRVTPAGDIFRERARGGTASSYR
jgi:hypothetical protein